jgi:hypothetical protein
MSARPQPAEARRGGALALPLLLCALAMLSAVKPARADGIVAAPVNESDHLDAGSRMVYADGTILDAMSGSVHFPRTGGTFTLYGGGATIAPGSLRMQVAGWTGGLQASAGPKMTTWGLNLASLNMEQRYVQGAFLVTGGMGLDYGQFTGGLDNAQTAQLTRLESNVWGYSATAGLRWPAQSRLAFFVRSGFEWMQGDGRWKGYYASTPAVPGVSAQLGGEHINLDGLNVTGQIELSFQ